MGGGEQQQHVALLVFLAFSRASASPPPSRIPEISGNGGGSTPGQTPSHVLCNSLGTLGTLGTLRQGLDFMFELHFYLSFDT